MSESPADKAARVSAPEAVVGCGALGCLGGAVLLQLAPLLLVVLAVLALAKYVLS